MFGVILVFAVTLMQVYVFWRASTVPFVMRRIARKHLAGFGLALWALFLLGRFVAQEDAGAMAAPLELLGMTWMGILFLMSVPLLAVEVATGFNCFLKRLGPFLRGLALVAGGLLSLVALIQGLRAPVMQRYDVYLAGLPAELDGTVIVALSDLHLGAVLDELWLAARVAQVQAENPDIVVLIGDVFEGHAPPQKKLLAALHRLSAPQGTWAVLGNHEFHAAQIDNGAIFKEAGIRLLRNTWVELRPGLILAGVDGFPALNGAGATEAFLAKSLAGRPAGATILLSHTPLPAAEIASSGVGLMLNGHTHGGQIWPFGYLVKQRFPLFEGRYELGGLTAIVSRGTGTWGPRMRLWHPAEILRVTLHADCATNKHVEKVRPEGLIGGGHGDCAEIDNRQRAPY